METRARRLSAYCLTTGKANLDGWRWRDLQHEQWGYQKSLDKRHVLVHSTTQFSVVRGTTLGQFSLDLHLYEELCI